MSSSSRKRVAGHYDALAEHTQSYKERKRSPAIRVKTFNNCVKQALLRYCRTLAGSPNTVCGLDLCCGRGGDLWKWSAINTRRLTMIDVSPASIDEAKDREREMPDAKRIDHTSFHVHNCFEPFNFTTAIGEDDYDIVSCQFAAHYAFGNRADIDGLMRNASARLRHNGGVFVCTVPAYDRLARRVETTKPSLSFGNLLYKVEYDEATRDHDFSTNSLGIGYRFSLVDAVESLTEYCVPPLILVTIARAQNLDLTLHSSLRLFAESQRRTEPKLDAALCALRVEDAEVVDFYDVFIFRHRESK